MFKKAFSLIEVMVALTLGLLTLGFLLHFQNISARQERALQSRNRNAASLSLAREELQRVTRGLDAEFWREFPRSLPLIHPVDHLHGPLQFSDSCPDHPDNACLTLFDIRPRREDPTLYQAIADDFPRLVRLSPIGGYGEAFSIEPQDVLLFSSATNTFCALTHELLVDQVELATAESQPWTRAEQLPEDALILNLGALEVWHIYLETAGALDHELVYEPWSLEQGRWQAGRRHSTQANLSRLLFQACDAEQPDRLTLVQHIAKGRTLAQPLVLAGESFDKEVSFDTLEF